MNDLWWIPNRADIRVISDSERLKRLKNKDLEQASRVDERIMFCDKCSKCYEEVDFISKRRVKDKVVYYNDFPSINKKRRRCPKCI